MRNSPNRRDGAGGLGLDGANCADETVVRVASPGMLATGLPTTASLPPRRTSPACCDLVRVGGLALDAGNRAG